MQNIKPEQLQNVYAELCSIIGVEATLKLYSAYKGQQVSFPQRLYAKEFVVNQIVEDYNNGKSVAEISKKYSYSTRWVNTIIKKRVTAKSVSSENSEK